MVERDAEIVNKFGLHARPAMQFVNEANRFASRIEVSKGELTVDAKSIMSVMRLAATKGTILTITADGDDASDAVDALAQLIQDGFGEMGEES
ncbi:MAG: HPr family phosphocarrier protein [Planctomycetes bacterium]|nr:HPr family phosphocarrier protein [Phycisphaerae bacterium]NBB95914.1 HPr family phosphocarrier protein [Planctomycetota bacterium]